MRTIVSYLGFTDCTVDIGKCVDVCGFRFVPEGTNADSLHPYTRALLERETIPFVDYHDSSLYAYYRDSNVYHLSDLFPELTDMPSDHPANSLPPNGRLTPWFGGDIEERMELTRQNLRREFPGVADPGDPTIGPLEDRQGVLEYRRLVDLSDSIKRRGFRMTRRRKNAIAGVILRTAADYRFVVMAGKHRVAALAAVITRENKDTLTSRSPTEISVALREPRVVRVEQVDTWPMVARGLWSKTAARMYFDRLFCGRSYVEIRRERDA